MSFVAVAIGGSAATLIGAGMAAHAAGNAADKQEAAANHASDMQYQGLQDQLAQQKSMYDQTRTDQEPWRQAGVHALSGLGSDDFQRDFTMGDFQKDPGYDFRMQEGQKALERSAAARGGLMSGGTMKGLAQYGQDYASNEYQNAYNRFNSDRDRRFNRLSSIAGIGQTANSQNAAAGANYANAASGAYGNYANQVGQNMMGAANAQGAAGVAQANAWGGALSGIANMGMQGAWMNAWKSKQG